MVLIGSLAFQNSEARMNDYGTACGLLRMDYYVL